MTEVSRTALMDTEFQASTEKRQSIRNPLEILKLKTKTMIVKMILTSILRVSSTAVDNPVMRHNKDPE